MSTRNEWSASVKWFRTTTGALLLLGVGLLAPAGGAIAGGYRDRPVLVSCIGKETATWSPGLSRVVQPYAITVDNQWPACRILERPSTLSASSQAQFTVTESCDQFGIPAQATWIINWSSGDKSKFQFNASVNISRGNLMITAPGMITEGLYRGSEAIATFTLIDSAGTFTSGCDTPQGVTTISGPSSLVILGN